ncbi:M1 family metallopeptidase [Adhaeribacter soli]|uniref:Aminopeptidase N n=1 Tax=Adhaeribacter soli TaxID=2607655 RepID=A0A5N1J9F0_9BACT|nr:M1 family metallopeptidase [Adhaeribacter soli]KAA9345935.1 M1 family metallopeptidase [Adhaeribacter soli]
MNSRTTLVLLSAVAALHLHGCNTKPMKENKMETTQETALATPARDVHSYSNPAEVAVKHLDLDIEVLFDQKIIRGKATYQLDRKKDTDKIILDSRNLKIRNVFDTTKKQDLAFSLGENQPTFGQPLEIQLNPDTKAITIEYETSPEAAALQWLSPQQTAGKVHPFLFTQSQAILARTWIPCQDSPGVRFTYNAKVKAPKEMLAVMSAENPQKKSADGVYTFKMDQPIPSYLMALSVGDLAFKPLSNRTGIYAEPVSLEAAAYEFAELDKMLVTAEKIYGKYRWGRYDLLLLPPSFPFGGMENPRITFVTPTILAGDRSLTSLVAHELAHSWSGNLVTNATWNDFWLNEGFTVYFERRIMEAMYGEEYSDMLKVLGHQDLHRTLEELGSDQPDTRLRLELEGRDPDEGLTDIAYEKGNYFLLNIENAVGRDKFDQFLNKYFNQFAFQTTTTESFVNFLNKELIKGDAELAKKINLEAWIYQPGIPAGAIPISSTRFEKAAQAATDWQKGKPAKEISTKDWSSHEWLHFLRQLPAKLTPEQMQELDKAFNFTNSGNSEILAAWLEIAVKNNYRPADKALENFLTHVGRRKFLIPLYKALLESPEGRERAQAIYKKARTNYHAVSTATIDELLAKK